MKENWDAKLMAHLCMTGLGSVLTILMAIAGPRLAIAAPSLMTGVANFGLARHYGKRRELGAGSAMTACVDVLSDYWGMLQTVPEIDPTEVVWRRVTGENIPSFNVETRSLNWFDRALVTNNLCLIGGAGSGKSVLAKFIADKIVAEHGPDSMFGLLSTHYESNPKNPLDKWFAGVPHQELTGIVCREKDENQIRLNQFYSLMRQRRSAEDTDAPPKFLIVDDFQYQFEDLEDAAAKIQSIVDEGRKYNVRILLVLHSIKTKNVEFDSTALWSMTSIIWKSALADKNSARLWPDDIQDGKKELIAQIDSEVNALNHSQSEKLIAIVRPGGVQDPKLSFQSAAVRLLPDRAKSQISFKVEDGPWLDSVTTEILEKIEAQEITSFTAACRFAGVGNHMQKRQGQYRDERVKALWLWWKDLEFNQVLSN